LLDLPCLVTARQGILIASHKARLWTRRIQFLRCVFVFQLHCVTKRTFMTREELARLSSFLRLRERNEKNKKR
jgi:hypothetical protein